LLPAVLPGGAWPVAVVVGFLTGLSTPPVTAMSRASFPRLAKGAAQSAVFTVEASMQEVMYVVGPALAATVVAVWDAQVALWLCGLLAVFGALGFAGALRRPGRTGGGEAGGGRTPLADGSLSSRGDHALVMSLVIDGDHRLGVIAPCVRAPTGVAWVAVGGAGGLTGVGSPADAVDGVGRGIAGARCCR
ncbi:hypothetical protein K7G98_13810, partial [Saccharothrix sp. MB29]|nr:hypothetical protein [Saccharothrix sp. MB29]